MSICETDLEILSLILRKEELFFQELQQLTLCLQSNDLSDYIAALKDLKNDFLIPLKKRLSEKSYENLFSNRYWYFDRT